MERLTIRSKNSDMVWFKDAENGNAHLEPCEMTAHHNRMALDKLAAYEDAEEQGRILPAPLDGVERFSLDGGKTIWQRVYEPDMTEEGAEMNENEAIEVLKDFDKQVTAKADGAYQTDAGKMACDTAIKALEEVQQYRALGTLEELQIMKEHGGFTGVELAQIAAGQMKLKEYQTIGTPEECRAAREKQIPKRPKEYEDKYFGCPTCGNVLLHKWEKYPNKLMDKSNGLPYCLGCGQKFDWSDEE